MKSEDVVVALSALAQESRLAIFRLLVRRGPEGYSPTDLTEKLSIPAPTLSFHLKELQRSGLLAQRRSGRFLYYSANFDRMRGLIEFLTQKCCSDADAQCDSDCVPVASTKRRRA